jgi:uncharacterized protein
MFRVLPERITPDQLLAAGGRLQGSLALAGLERLASYLQGSLVDHDSVSVDLTLILDSQGRHWVKGRIRSRLPLRCERCQGQLEWPMETTVGLVLVPNEAAALELAGDLDYVVAGDSLKLHELIEDELILALPLVPKHPQGTKCGDRALKGPLAESGERANPFAILKKLKV